MDTAARLLRLLSLLQSQPAWRGDELADRLGVTTRTVRRDVTRLRSLGYPVDAAAGIEGGYRLGTGGRLPPLLLDDDEAVAIAVGLRVAATSTLAGAEAAVVAALAKLDQVLPSRLRERVGAVHAATIPLPGPELPTIDAEVLVTLATGCRRGEGIRFDYRDHDGNETERSVEPYQIVHTGRRWYLVGRDRDRREWRTFRVDRVGAPILTGHRYTFEDPPDAAALVSEGTTVAPWDIEARFLVSAPPADVRRFYPPTMAVVEADGGDGSARSLLRISANHIGPLVRFAMGIPFPFEVLDPPELRSEVRKWAARITRNNK